MKHKQAIKIHEAHVHLKPKGSYREKECFEHN